MHVINNFVYAYVHFMLCRGVSVYVSYMHICLNHVFMYDKYRHSKKVERIRKPTEYEGLFRLQ